MKDDDLGDDMSGADIFIITKSGVLDDRYAVENEEPKKDSANGGTNDLILISHEKDGDNYVTIFERNFNTGDTFGDIVLREGARYTVIYAYGSFDDEEFEEEDDDDRGHDFLIFETDYDDDDESDDKRKENYSAALHSLYIAVLTGLAMLFS